MNKRTCTLVGVAGGMIAAMWTASIYAQQTVPDIVLTNGKIITVDDRFSIAQAVAIKGDRIVAVGTNQTINQSAGPGTRRIDLRGRSVVPGLIDNHAHYMEEGALWQLELRLDGVETRKAALEMVRAKAATVPAGEWVFSLGGWSTDQFTDDKKPFSREELDRAAPQHPVLLQFTRAETYLNSAALKALGLEDPKPDPKRTWIKRDAAGRPTGVIDAAGADPVREKIPQATGAVLADGNLAMVRDLNRAGLTASGGTCPDEYMDMYRQWARENRLNKRFFCLVSVGAGNSAATVDKALPQIAQFKLFQGDSWVDQFAYGEGFYGPASDSMVAARGTQRPEDFVQWGRIAREVAKAGMPANIHTTLEATADGFLNQIEEINKEFPIRNLRWALIHGEQLTAAHLERMKRLGMYASIQPRATIMGGIYNRVHGERSYDMPALKMIQDSGIMWGLGTDTFEVNQYRPFTTLWFAVTGKMVGGTVVNRQPISREDALIAHTRKNAFFIFQEDNLGSIQPGKFADLVVLDRDYLTVPADQIKDITSVMTIVGGRIAYEAN
jgi:predicted amidohydrolase YtcJ